MADQELLERCVKECLECTDLTAACAQMMARNSEFSAQVCGACAEVCEKYESDIMRRCAKDLRQMQTAAA